MWRIYFELDSGFIDYYEFDSYEEALECYHSLEWSDDVVNFSKPSFSEIEGD